ncbi:MAG: hypothetical protein CBC03_18185 [Pseudoalteromonas sp. TMED43]|jgi:hypothetical protein|nr:MAG: hypothetical protein CBC03_18185 [Pseudoalteromonas sp. TMED43]|tara:strand:+ start:968 stop:1186 length:219 start_codon:yes stop_codon:yes gene_type:complete
MSNSWKDFMSFINDHPVGVALKVFAATGLTWLVDNIGDFGWPPILVVAIPPAVVVLVDWLNGQNDRFGRHDG